MNYETAIKLARKNLGGKMESSARLCLADAIACIENGDLEAAQKRALDSLRYSVGIFHPDYIKARQ